MKRKLFALLALVVLITPTAFAHAAVDHVIMQGFTATTPTQMAITARFMDGDVLTEIKSLIIPITGLVNPQAMIDAVTLATTDYAAFQGYTAITSGSQIVWPWQSPADVDSKIAAATSTLPLPVPMAFATTTRSLNSAFQVSSTRAAFVSYTVDVATTLSLTGGQTGTVSLQYADDSGFTTNVKTIQSTVNGNTGTLTIGLALTQTNTAAVTGMIPAGKYVKLVTANTTGTPTFTFRAAQEVLLPSN